MLRKELTMPYQFLAALLLVACMCLFLTFSIFLKASTSLIALALLGVGVASGIFIKHWAIFVRKTPQTGKRNKIIAAALLLFGYFTALAVAALAVGVFLTGDPVHSMKFAGFLESLFVIECILFIARA
jgi:hypothetical protein